MLSVAMVVAGDNKVTLDGEFYETVIFYHKVHRGKV